MRRWGTAIAAIVLASAGLAGTAGAAQAVGTSSAAACATAWGSLEKTAPLAGGKPLANIKTSQNECYDRMVFDIKGATAADKTGFRVGYVETLNQAGTGDPIAVGGGAILEIKVGASTYDYEAGERTYPGQARQQLPGVDVSGYQTFRDTRFASSFEGETQIGLGVRARLPFRVLQSDGHVIVDVAHSWNAAS